MKAANLTAGDRNASYGDPLPNHERIAAIWTVILGHDSRVRVGEPDAVAKEAVAAMVEVVRGHQRRFVAGRPATVASGP